MHIHGTEGIALLICHYRLQMTDALETNKYGICLFALSMWTLSKYELSTHANICICLIACYICLGEKLMSNFNKYYIISCFLLDKKKYKVRKSLQNFFENCIEKYS